EYFLENPLPEARGSYKVTEWSFPGRRAVDRKIAGAERLVSTAEKLTRKIPRSKLARDTARRVDRMRRRLDFMKRLAELYGPYAEYEVIYSDNRARELLDSLPEEDRRDFSFDAAEIEWRHYLHEIHFPMLTAPLRWVAPRRPDPVVKISPNGSPPRSILAVFDVEGTIVASNVVEAYWWLRAADSQGLEKGREAFALARRIPGLLKAESRDRGEFLRRFYRLYAGASEEAVRELASRVMPDLFLRRLSPGAVRRVRAHRVAGHRVIFVTASLDFVVEAVRPLADEMVAARLSVEDGVFTGDIERPPLVGEARASWLEQYAAEAGAELEECYAYADSLSDLPLLEAAGNPVAVNPDISLSRIARARRWPIEEWPADPGTPKFLMPGGASDYADVSQDGKAAGPSTDRETLGALVDSRTREGSR
ncbi:MAG: HAD-IB family hydrolase, partial [Actinomycetota bacterium]